MKIFMLLSQSEQISCLFATPSVSNSWASEGHIAWWQSCRGPHDVFDLEIIACPGSCLCNVKELGLYRDYKLKRSIFKKQVITSPVSPHHHPSSGIVNQKSSSVARSGFNLQIEKVCIPQVSPVLRSSNVSSKMKRCNTAEIH